MGYKVVITDVQFPTQDPERRTLGDIADLVVAPGTSPEALVAAARDADAVINTYAKLPGEVLRGLTKCRIVARTGIGVDTVDMPTATALGIIVTNVPDYCIDEVSDHALALTLSLTRKVVSATAAVRAGAWGVKVAVPIARHRGRTLGLVGLGKIPRALVPKAQALGFQVIAFDPYVPPEGGAPLGVRMVDFETLLRESDVVSIHAPLTDETKGLFGDREFGLMKPGAFIVNTSRGPLIQGAALVRALESGRLAGAGLDVLDVEPPPAGSPLLQMPNVAVTPHIGYYSEESQVELQTKAAQEVRRVLTGEAPRNVVNRDVLPRARAAARTA
ncbi:MAG TPA: C-terminal binding protein [Candidatus Sulfotelmatobacter sp.]|nr:C-terminal binding protein [Candidatus Sulfotelmatobacter sp.]